MNTTDPDTVSRRAGAMQRAATELQELEDWLAEHEALLADVPGLNAARAKVRELVATFEAIAESVERGGA